MRPKHRYDRIGAGIALCALLALSAGCRAAGPPQTSPNVPSSSELVESPDRYDGSGVTFTGEAIGEAMVRGDMAWLHLNDDAYYLKNVEEGAQLGGYNSGMPVWIPSGQTRAITYFGDHGHEGDIVTANGVFNAACPEHGGDMDIHATSLAIEKVGHVVDDPVRPDKVVWALVVGALALLLYLTNRYIERPGHIPGR